jgi:hypothetical protein
MREHGPAPIARALRVATNLAEALDYAAERQILHGALHPRDVLLSEDDIRIVGLGVSRALERVGVASPVRRPYSAPERINDEGWDQRADVFSLAAIVFELLCGRRVTGTGSDAADSLIDVAGCDADALRRVFALALAADPAYRFSTATAFTDALKDTTVAANVAAVEPSVSPSKPKARRPRAKLRVVTPTLIDADAPIRAVDVADSAESADPVHAVDVDVSPPSERELIEAFAPTDVEAKDIDFAIREAPESTTPAAALQLLEFAPERVDEVVPVELDDVVDEAPAFSRAHRKVPAPTPVAIETVAAVPDLLLDIETREPLEPPEPVEPLEPLKRVAPVDDVTPPEQPDLMAFSEAPESVTPAEERYIDVEPQPVEERVAEPELPVEPRLPAFLNPEFSPSVPAVAPSSNSPVWPIGVAAVIGIAVGFGFGYTVAIRDRGVVARAVVSSPAPASNIAQPTSPTPAPAAVERPIIEPLVAAQPPKAAPAKQVAPASAAPALFDGRVVVQSTPAGARVLVDGKDRGQTPAIVRELGRGEHRIRIVRDGYTAAERRVVLSESRPSQLLSVPLARDPRTNKSPVPPKPNAKPAEADVAPKPVASTSGQPGTLVVESRPEGAVVLVDGRVAGRTPLNIGDVRAGNHTIRIEREGYSAWTSTVTVNGGEQNRVTASLEEK